MARRRRKRKLKKWVKITIFLIIIVVVLIILCLLNRSKAVNSNIKSFVNTEKVSIDKVMLSINDDSIDKDFLEWYVCEQTVAYILDAERLPVIARAVAAVYADDTDERRAAELQRTADRLDRELEKLVDSLIDLPTSARPRIAERMGLLEAQKADAEADLAKLRMQQRIRVTEKEVAAWLRTFARGDLMDADFRQRAIDDFVNSVYLYEDKIVIFFNLRHGQETVYLDPDTDPIDPAALTPVNEKNPRLKRSTLTGEARAFPPKVEPQPPYLIFIRGVPGIVIPR